MTKGKQEDRSFFIITSATSLWCNSRMISHTVLIASTMTWAIQWTEETALHPYLYLALRHEPNDKKQDLCA